MKLSIDLGLQELQDMVTTLTKKVDTVMATLAETLAAVQAEKTAVESLIAQFTGLQTQLNAVLAGALPPALQSQVDAIFAAAQATASEITTATAPAPATTTTTTP